MSRRSLVTSLVAGSTALLVALGTGAWWAADRFLIEHVAVSDVQTYEAEQQAESGVTAEEPSVASLSADGMTATSEDATVAVRQVVQGTGADTVTYYVADVTMSDATVLQSAFANNQFGENIIQNPSEIAAANNAIFAVNGDYYGFRDTGIVIRNGVVYRDAGAREGLAFYLDGTVAVYDETATSAQALLDAGVWNTLSFGPAIVTDGAVVDGIESVEVDTNFGNHSIQGEQPRTVVGVIDENHLVFVVVDGRNEGYSRGVTTTEAAEIMISLGAQTAYNLDGGGSSTMVFNGAVVNQPSNGGERGTSDILYIGGAA